MAPEPTAITHRLLLGLALPPQAQFLLQSHSWADTIGAQLFTQVNGGLGFAAGAPVVGLHLSRVASVRLDGAQQGEGLLVFIYLDFDSAQVVSLAQLGSLQTLLKDYFSSNLQPQWVASGHQLPLQLTVNLSRLELKLDLKGHAWGQEPSVHYVVQTDVEEGWMSEIESWYDIEHMPGLASVPGCMSAKRLINHDAGPRSFACYDLESAQVLTSGPWMAVRATDWSSRARPHFVNPQRMVMDRL